MRFFGVCVARTTSSAHPVMVRRTATRARTASLCRAPRRSPGTTLRNKCGSASDRCHVDCRSNLSLVASFHTSKAAGTCLQTRPTLYTMLIKLRSLLCVSFYTIGPASLARENEAGGSWGQEVHLLHVNI